MEQNSNQPWWRGARGEWYVVVQMTLFLLFAFGPESTPWLPRWNGTLYTFIAQPLGGILTLCGALLLIAGIIHLGRNLTVVPHPKDGSELVTNGAYRIARHPIYSGIIIGAFGWSMWKGSLLMICYTLLLFLFFDIKSRREERWLSDKFEAYAGYQERVRKLIPWVY